MIPNIKDVSSKNDQGNNEEQSILEKYTDGGVANSTGGKESDMKWKMSGDQIEAS